MTDFGGLSGSRKPNQQAVSALTGFDPGRVIATAFWSFPPLCWAIVWTAETEPLFGLPRWVHALITLAFFAMIVGKIYRAQSTGEQP